MGKHTKLYKYILTKRSDANAPFTGLCALLKELGFQERIRGDHYIYTQDGVAEILNLQPRNGQGKPYQVKQIRNIILQYNLKLEK